MRKFLPALFCLISFYTQAQQPINHFINAVIPPAPNAAAMQKFVDNPVSLHTGVPEITVPLYQLEAGTLKVPVSISYHASGLKVDDIASWVGNGWTLNAAGTLSRTIRGRPDDDATGQYFSTGSTGTNLFFDGNVPKSLSTLNNFCAQHGNNKYELQKLVDGCYDTEPDRYFYSAPGISGKFLFLRDGTRVQLDQTKINLEVTEGTVGSPAQWKVTGEDGTGYLFGKSPYDAASYRDYMTQTRSTRDACSQAPQGYNTWHITAIISANKADTVFYEYEDEDTEYTSVNTIYYTVDGLTTWKAPQPSNSTTNITGHRLKKIFSTRGDSVVFIADAMERQDLEGGHALKEVRIYQRGQEMRSFRFTYAYKAAYPEVSSDAHENKYLFLNEVREYSSDRLSSLPPYEFEYKTLTDGVFPNRRTMRHDHWGYFTNDAYNRLDPNPATMDVGVLTKIIYPTGGYRALSYEPHTYSGLTSTEYLSHNIHIDYLGKAAYHAVPFTLPEDGTGTIIWSKANSAPDAPGCYLRIVNGSGTIVWNQFAQTGQSTISLPAGSYEIRSINSTVPLAIHEMTLDLIYETDTVLVNKSGAGIRIREIELAAGYENPNLVYSYRYNQDNGNSSGRLKGVVKNRYMLAFDNNLSTCVPPSGEGFQSTIFEVINRKNFSNGNSSGAGNVTYGLVTVIEGTETNLNGKSVHAFTNITGSNNSLLTTFPVAEPSYQEYKLGLETQRDDYRYNSGTDTFEKIRSIVNTYAFANEQIIKSLKSGYTYNSACLSCTGPSSQAVFGFDIIEEYAGRNYLSSAATTVFDGVNSTTDLTEYAYENPSHMQLTRIKKYKGSTAATPYLTTQYTYALDIGSPTSAESYMQSNNICTLVVKEEQFDESSPVTSIRINFALEDGMLVRRSVDKAKGAGSYVQQVVYNNFDTRGNLLELTTLDGITRSYQYLRDYPIAEVIGCAPGQFFHTSFEDTGTPDASARTGTRLHSGTFSVPVPAAGKYTLTYWMKTGSGPWTLTTQTVLAVSATTQLIGAPGSVLDEVRLFPVHARMTTYTYADGTGITSGTDANNRVRYYHYDTFNRLTAITDDEGNVVKNFLYNYNGQN